MKEIEKYTWGDGCEAWKLTDTPELSVIREKMPAGTSEKMHYHIRANQVFYILEGTATFSLNGEIHILQKNDFIKIKAGAHHQIINATKDTLEFIVISQPRAHGDRIDL